MAPHSSVLAWRIPGTGEPGGLPSMGSQSRTRLKWLSSSTSSKKDQISLQYWIFLPQTRLHLSTYSNLLSVVGEERNGDLRQKSGETEELWSTLGTWAELLFGVQGRVSKTRGYRRNQIVKESWISRMCTFFTLAKDLLQEDSLGLSVVLSQGWFCPQGTLTTSGGIFVCPRGEEGASGISWVLAKGAAPYPARHMKLPQQRMIWPQISVVPRLRILSLKGLKGKKATIRETI